MTAVAPPLASPAAPLPPETLVDPARLDRVAIAGAAAWEGARGELVLLAMPALVETHLKRLQMLATVLGNPFNERGLVNVRAALEQRAAEGFAASPYSMLRVRYGPAPNPRDGLIWQIETVVISRLDRAREFLKHRPPEQFGQFPDAKLMAVAEQLGAPATAPVLDVGAGTGRNALALAERGHPVTALEENALFVEVIQQRAWAAERAIEVQHLDLLNPLLELPRQHYALAVLSGVVPYFDGVRELRLAIARLTHTLRPGGYLLFDTFVTTEGYQASQLVIELSRFSDSYLFSPQDLHEAIGTQPLDLVSDEAAWDYEAQHLEPAARAVRGWLDAWARADRLFPLPDGQRPPVSLRWQLYRKRG